MTNKELARKAKDYLKQVTFAEKEIKLLKARIAHYEDLTRNITHFSTDTPLSVSRGSSRVETAAVGIVDALSSLNANLGAYTAIVSDAEKQIAKVPQEKFRRLLTLRYLCSWSMRSVSDELDYSDRNSIYRAHGFALLELGKVLTDDGKKSD